VIPLPEPYTEQVIEYSGIAVNRTDKFPLFTADQMHAYAAARVAEAVAEKDAERYRFLRKDFSPMGLNIDGNHAWAYRRNATLKGPTLDAAIDAAIRAGSAGGEK
jgi:hypothetical protein